MPSTYSSLKVELIATGEQSGTWGNTTNTNLGTALGEAITGSADVTFINGSDTTVTLTDVNTTQAARNLRLNLIGSANAPQSLILGSGCQINKLYLINNTLGYAITVKNTTGTGIAVPAGKTMFVFNNGTNVVDAITHLTSLSTGAITSTQVNITGQGDLRLEDTTGGEYVALQAPGTLASSYTLTLPVDDGTNGQALITDGSGNLSWSTAASGDVYGPASATDNAVVRFDSTTGKLIKNSGVIIDNSNNVTGVADFTNTGNTTLGNASGDTLTITGTTVTTPNGLNFDSNTLVIDAANNRVGVNNATPTTALDVTGTATISTNLAFTGTGNRITGDFSNATVANRVLLQTSTTNGNTNLTLIPNGTGTNVSLFLDSDSATTNSSRLAMQILGASEARITSGTQGSGTALPLTMHTGGSERLRIDTSGNVGIGTSSPSYKLHVVGTGTTAQARVESTSTANGQISFINTSTSSTGFVVGLMNDTSGDALIYHQDAKNIRFYTSSTERMRITSDGKVGIGTTSPVTTGGSLFEISNSVNCIATITCTNDTTSFLDFRTNGVDRLQIQSSSNWGAYFLVRNNQAMLFGTNNTERMRIDSSGNVGIGVSNPVVPLDVRGSASTTFTNNPYTLSLVATNTYGANIGPGVHFTGKYNTAGNLAGFATISGVKENATDGNYAGALTFMTRENGSGAGNQERMRITSAGDVGIGTTSPKSVGNYRFVTTNATTGSGYSTQVNGTEATNLYAISSGTILQEVRALPLVFETNATERMRITSGGNVLIGATSTVSSARFLVAGVSSTTSPAVQGSASAGAYQYFYNNAQSSSSFQIGQGFASGTDNIALLLNNANAAMVIGTNGTERMRITSGGNVLVGTSTDTDGRFQVSVGADTPAFFINTAAGNYDLKLWNQATSGDNSFVLFITEGSTGTARGSITYNRGGGVVAYNTTSDYRLKENIVNLPNALQTVTQLKPRQFDWKETGNTTTGFIAHELAEILPHAVTGKKDAVDEEGKPVYQGVDTSFLVATLTAAIQEQQAMIVELTNRIKKLEGA